MAEPTTAKIGRPRVDSEIRFWQKVDQSSDCWIWLGGTTQDGHGQFWSNDKHVYAHRYAWELLGNEIPNYGWFHPTKNPQGWVLDHDNPIFGCGNPKCVNPQHLEAVPLNVNNRRGRGLRVNNTSGFTGVTWNAGSQKWEATARHNGKRYWFGYFDNPQSAAEFRSIALKEIDDE